MSGVPGWVYHRDIRGWVDKIHLFIDRVGKEGVDEVDRLWKEMGMSYLPIKSHGGYYTCPILSPEACEYVMNFANAAAAEFTVNMEEGEQYRIPEIILKHKSVNLDNDMKAVGRELLWPLFELIYGARPNHFTSVQLARYSVGDVEATGWHHDTDSEASCVVSLAPHLHRGGGTALRPCGALAKPAIVAPLPMGHGLLFNGRTTLHRGLPLDRGQRNLLVYWMVNNTDIERWKYE